MYGGIAEWLCSGLQSRGRRFDSDSRLHLSYYGVFAAVAKQVDARDLKSLGIYNSRAGSIPARGTIYLIQIESIKIKFNQSYLMKSFIIIF